MWEEAASDDLYGDAEPASLPGALICAAWLLIGQGLAFAVTGVLAIQDLYQVSTDAPQPGTKADIDRFRVVMTSIERDRIVLFML